MKHSDLRVGMKVKRVDNFNNDFYTSTDGNISTVHVIYDKFFCVQDDGPLVWDAKYFEPVEEIKEEVQMQEDNKISMDKKYRTRCGYPVRVLCVDMKNELYPVVALVKNMDFEGMFNFTSEGNYVFQANGHKYDLIEVSPWEDFKKDDKVMVSQDGTYWYKRYFAYEEDGMPYVYRNGCDSWSTYKEAVSQWANCRKPTKEELGEEQQSCSDKGVKP